MNILVVSPHPDDEVLGCGGTITKHVESGDNVHVVIMTNASFADPELYPESQVATVRAEAKNVHKELGVHETHWFDFPAPMLDQYPQYKIAAALSKLIEQLQTEVMYIPHRGDLHLDHGVIYNASLVAVRPFPGQTVKEVYAYETLSETEWGHPASDSVFIPTLFVELNDKNILKKINAMQFFKSQLKEFPNTRSIRSIKNLAEVRGSTIGCNYAESFSVVRILKTKSKNA
jgi:N-acetylglucosamine malate deacetylase 1